MGRSSRAPAVEKSWNCIRYNIGTGLAVFVLGYLHLTTISIPEPCLENLRPNWPQKVLTFGAKTGLSPVPDREKAQKASQLEQSSPKVEVAKIGREEPLGRAVEEDEGGGTKEEIVDEDSGSISKAAGGVTDKARWIFCAAQWRECHCDGKVRWGDKDRWLTIDPPSKGKPQDVKCNVQSLKDILPGDDGKHCECFIVPGTDFYKGLSPMLLPDVETDEAGAKVVASCEMFEAGKDDGPHGVAQWEAAEPFCSEAWEDKAKSDPLLQAGDRQISLDALRQLMRARVDRRFAGNYDKLFVKGWAPRAFVNYFAGPPTGKHARMTEELIRSVHVFSSEPIVVVHFGISSPASWNPERFPRLVLLHASELDNEAQRSFNFNKLRAFLMARVMTGVGLDSDQFVAPGVDTLFKMTEREITKDYPIPMMPVHFLDRGPKDLGSWWPRYCPHGECSLQTLRWGHAHPTWTFWALPFYGRWLRRNFRDESLQALVHPIRAPALRVTDIPEDEDLLNVAMWEEKATKQWCKFDTVDPSEFSPLMNWKRSMQSKCMGGTGCYNILGDKRFYRNGGAAKLFFTAHHAVVPKETARYIDTIAAKVMDNAWPPPIVFNRQFWHSGDELRAAHPKLECLV
ncbi:unnamed protein product [Polarella glacialis]|uniref:Uncharacterized protein n=1 Tax=Polarella glacialis TaxID=89957 RepID=A0A813J5V1_POLGL|nr:unnamed protein product [Polarella glacialis]CAE8667154.1 unnamed protein product [Polarella glacialis]